MLGCPCLGGYSAKGHLRAKSLGKVYLDKKYSLLSMVLNRSIKRNTDAEDICAILDLLLSVWKDRANGEY